MLGAVCSVANIFLYAQPVGSTMSAVAAVGFAAGAYRYDRQGRSLDGHR
jgi:hypothetical protein